MRDPLAGIKEFAPEFWRLLADQVTPPAPNEAPGSAAAEQPPPDVTPPTAPTLPPLTNDALEEFRESLRGFGKNLQDIPPSRPAPYPPFTGVRPPLTNEDLRGFRDRTPEAWELRDIPSPPEHLLPQPWPPGLAADLSRNIKEIWKRRDRIDRLEKEKLNPQRSESERAQFDEEIKEDERVLKPDTCQRVISTRSPYFLGAGGRSVPN